MTIKVKVLLTVAVTSASLWAPNAPIARADDNGSFVVRRDPDAKLEGKKGVYFPRDHRSGTLRVGLVVNENGGNEPNNPLYDVYSDPQPEAAVPSTRTAHTIMALSYGSSYFGSASAREQMLKAEAGFSNWGGSAEFSRVANQVGSSESVAYSFVAESILDAHTGFDTTKSAHRKPNLANESFVAEVLWGHRIECIATFDRTSMTCSDTSKASFDLAWGLGMAGGSASGEAVWSKSSTHKEMKLNLKVVVDGDEGKAVSGLPTKLADLDPDKMFTTLTTYLSGLPTPPVQIGYIAVIDVNARKRRLLAAQLDSRIGQLDFVVQRAKSVATDLGLPESDRAGLATLTESIKRVKREASAPDSATKIEDLHERIDTIVGDLASSKYNFKAYLEEFARVSVVTIRFPSGGLVGWNGPLTMPKQTDFLISTRALNNCGSIDGSVKCRVDETKGNPFGYNFGLYANKSPILELHRKNQSNGSISSEFDVTLMKGQGNLIFSGVIWPGSTTSSDTGDINIRDFEFRFMKK